MMGLMSWSCHPKHWTISANTNIVMTSCDGNRCIILDFLILLLQEHGKQSGGTYVRACGLIAVLVFYGVLESSNDAFLRGRKVCTQPIQDLESA